MQSLFIFNLSNEPWYQATLKLEQSIENHNSDDCFASYVELFRSLALNGCCSLEHAIASHLLQNPTLLSAPMPSETVKQAAKLDLQALTDLLKKDWHAISEGLCETTFPPLADLSSQAIEPLEQSLIDAMAADNLDLSYQTLLNSYETNGTGVLARYLAFNFSDQKLTGIAHPTQAKLERLMQVEKQLKQLSDNTEAFLAGHKAQHTVLYGSRGSGKSTAVRALLNAYSDQGLRLVDVAVKELVYLADLTEKLRTSPHKFIIFVDDLSFEQGDTRYQPLKTLLEGSSVEAPKNVLIYATSNRRHLIKEQFSDRPDPLNDDVHGWDTQNEKLALSDRFGLTITFPNANQKRYLEIVYGLAEQEGIRDDDLKAKAIRYAEWGNGYSGRTAQQFIESTKANLA